MSHSIDMLSIQIDTKLIHYQFNNFKLSFFASLILYTVIRYSRVPPRLPSCFS